MNVEKVPFGDRLERNVTFINQLLGIPGENYIFATMFKYSKKFKMKIQNQEKDW